MSFLFAVIILLLSAGALIAWIATAKDPGQNRESQEIPSITVRNYQALSARHSFSEFLPYLHCDDKEGVYVMSDGVGFVMETPGLSGTGPDVWNQLRGIYEIDYPAGASISFMVFADPNIEPILAKWSSLRNGTASSKDRRQGGIYRKLSRSRFEFLKKGIRDPIYPGLEMRFRNFRHIISVKIPAGNSPSETKAQIEKLIKLRAAVIQQLNAIQLHPEVMKGTRLCQLLVFLLNPNHPEWKQTAYNPDIEMRKQLVYADNKIKITPEYLNIDKACVSLQTIKQYPAEIPLWAVHNLLGDTISNNKQIPVPFVSVMHAHFPDQETEKKKLELAGAWATRQALGQIAKYVPKLILKKDNYDIITGGLAAGGRAVKVFHQLLLYGRNDLETAKAVQAAKAVYQNYGFTLQSDQYISVPLFINALPLGFLTKGQKDINRANTMTSQNAAHLTPIQSDFSGTRTHTILFDSRRGQLTMFDIFDNTGGNYNALIAAASGAGKSYVVNEFTVSYLSIGGKVRIIDVGRSYQSTCAHLGGQWMEFSSKSNISLNPFSKIKNIKDELEILTPLIGQMVSPSRNLTDWEKNTLDMIIQDVFLTFGTKTTIDHIADALLAHEDLRGRDLGVQLFSYTSKGRRGRFFEGENNCDLNNPLVVLELEELKSDPDLQSVVLLLILYTISQEVYFSNRREKIIVIIDEAWSLLGDGPAAVFIENAYRRFRKYGGACITVTQGINDYYKTAATRACFENSDWMFLLRQKPESINALRESKRLDLSPAEFDMLSTIHTISGQYSEVFVSCSGLGRAIGRFYGDPFSYWLYTTAPQDHALRDAFLQTGLKLEQAIDACVETHNVMRKTLKEGKTVDQAVMRCLQTYNSNHGTEEVKKELIYG